MSTKEYWQENPYLAVAFREADGLRRQSKSNEQWMQGVYIYQAFAVVLGNALSKKGSPKQEYLTEPIRVIPLTEEEKQAKAEAERQKAIQYFNRLAKKWGQEEIKRR